MSLGEKVAALVAVTTFTIFAIALYLHWSFRWRVKWIGLTVEISSGVLVLSLVACAWTWWVTELLK